MILPMEGATASANRPCQMSDISDTGNESVQGLIKPRNKLMIMLIL